jgi:hypothetical protein
MRHDEPLRVDHATGGAILRSALEGESARPHSHSVLVALSLHDEDRAFVENWCLCLGRAAPDPGIRAVAALGISHVARRFRTVSPEAADLVRRLAGDHAVREAHSHVVDEALRRLQRFAR